MTAGSPLRSEGARLERKAMRAKLRRRIADMDRKHAYTSVRIELCRLLSWVLTREKRYDAKAGGL